MIKSMTGFGRGTASFAGGHIKAEIKSFNHKFFEPSFKMPENLQPFEEQIKKIVRKDIRRGKIYLWLNYEKCPDSIQSISLDEKRVRRYVTLLQNIKKSCGVKGDITLDHLLAFPDIIVCKPRKESSAKLWQATRQALKQALTGIIAMRKREGKVLAQDIARRAKSIEKAVRHIQQLLPKAVKRYELKIKNKICNGNDKNGISAERLQNEVALFAKNCDVSEELTRIRAHLDNIRLTLRTKNEAGKVLDFIAQEIHREINTVGAKSSDLKIARAVIYVKGEIEKIREQVQNIE